jgi:hypothetical protein
VRGRALKSRSRCGAVDGTVRLVKRAVAAAGLVLVLGAQAAIASAAPAPSDAASAGAHRIAARLGDWAVVKEAHVVGDRRCLLFRHAGQRARETRVFNARRGAVLGLSVIASASVYSSAASARRALAESASPTWQACSRGWYARMVRRQGLTVTALSGVPAWARPPAGSHAVAQQLVARLEAGQGALWNATYELEDTRDPRVVYGFSVAGAHPIPKALVRSLLALAARR